MPKKSEKKEAPPEPEPEPEIKLPKKKPSRQIPKEEPKEEESPFGKIKLKKAETVKRTWDDPGMETVDLKHHEFERAPQEEEVYQLTAVPECLCHDHILQPEGQTSVKLGNVIEDDDDNEEKTKKKKKKSKKEEPVAEPDEEEPAEEVTHIPFPNNFFTRAQILLKGLRSLLT